jgi:hypothetical protein
LKIKSLIPLQKEEGIRLFNLRLLNNISLVNAVPQVVRLEAIKIRWMDVMAMNIHLKAVVEFKD